MLSGWVECLACASVQLARAEEGPEYDSGFVATDTSPRARVVPRHGPGNDLPLPSVAGAILDRVRQRRDDIDRWLSSDRLHGARAEAGLGRVLHPEDREASRGKLLDAPIDGSITEVEYRVRRADGSYAWILSRFRKIVGEDESLWVHGAALDVTARHEAEDLRRQLEGEQARAAALEESRARIVEAGDEARRRLERDLHDGAQQRLIVSLMTLRRAASEAAGTSASPLLEQGIEHLEQGLAELRSSPAEFIRASSASSGLAHAVGRLAEQGAACPWRSMSSTSGSRSRSRRRFTSLSPKG